MDFETLKSTGRGGFEKTRRNRRDLWPFLASLDYHQRLPNGYDDDPISDIAARLCLLVKVSELLDLTRCNLSEFPVRKDYAHECWNRVNAVLLRKKDNFISDGMTVIALIVSDVLEQIQVTYYTISSMYDQPKFYLIAKNCRKFVMGATFHEMLRLFMPKTYSTLNSLLALEINFTSLLFEDYFIEILPPSIVYLMMDAYFVEGVKVLYRYAIALIWIYKSEIKASKFTDGVSFWLRIKQDAMRVSLQESGLLIDRLGLPHRLPEPALNSGASVLLDKNKLMTIAFDSIRGIGEKALRPMPISHNFIEQQHDLHTRRFTLHPSASHHTSTTKTTDRNASRVSISLESDFLSQNQIQQLGQALPKLIQTTLHWSLAYSANRDGWDMLSIYSKTKGLYPCIVLFYLAGEDGVVIGAIHTNELTPNGQIKGDGRINAVFQMHKAELVMYPWAGVGSKDPSKERGNEVTVNQWAVCSRDSLTFGGSSTRNTNALRYDGEYCGRVSTGYSDTYNNPPLWIAANEDQTKESYTYDLRDLEILCASSQLKKE